MSFFNPIDLSLPTRVSVLRMLAPMLLVIFLGFFAACASAQEVDVWVGTGGADGIFHLKLNTESGKLGQPNNVAKLAGSGFLAMHPTKKVLYSTGRQENKNGIAAFAIGMTEAKPVVAKPTAKANPDLKAAQLRLEELQNTFGPDHPAVKSAIRKVAVLSSKPTAPVKTADKKTEPAKKALGLKQLSFVETGDGGAACVAVDKTGKVAMSAQYGGGSVSTYQLNPDGTIKRLVSAIEHGAGSGVVGKRQDKAHPHWVGTSPDNKFLMVPDLGKDATVVYQLDSETGKATKHSEVPSPPGAGPRHMKFHGSGKYAYVLNELTLSVSVFRYDAASAKFEKIQEIESLPDGLKDEQLHSAAEIRIHPSGKFLYTSNRGHDSITVFGVDQESGKLNFVQREAVRGAWPRNFNIDPSGKWLLVAGRHTNTLNLFSIDQESGKLSYARKSVNIPAPICVVFGK